MILSREQELRLRDEAVNISNSVIDAVLESDVCFIVDQETTPDGANDDQANEHSVKVMKQLARYVYTQLAIDIDTEIS